MQPLLIYDGKCGFCRIWLDYWKQLTGDRIAYAPSQGVADQYPQIPREAFAESVQLVRPDGSVASGARAVFETLGRERLYESTPLLAASAEVAYRFIARRRSFFYWLTRLSFGKRIEPARFALTQWLFLRLLASGFGLVSSFRVARGASYRFIGRTRNLAGARIFRADRHESWLDALLGGAQPLLVELERCRSWQEQLGQAWR